MIGISLVPGNEHIDRYWDDHEQCESSDERCDLYLVEAMGNPQDECGQDGRVDVTDELIHLLNIVY